MMMLKPPQRGDTSVRSINIDLSRPVPGDIGVPLGVIVQSGDTELGAQWYTEHDSSATTFLSHPVTEIPVGTTVPARQIDVAFQIDGATHVLQMGPQPYGHCYSDGTAIYGTGTASR